MEGRGKHKGGSIRGSRRGMKREEGETKGEEAEERRGKKRGRRGRWGRWGKWGGCACACESVSACLFKAHTIQRLDAPLDDPSSSLENRRRRWSTLPNRCFLPKEAQRFRK